VASWADDLTLALDLADVADAVTVPAFRNRDLIVETKPDLTPVTAADRGTEEAIRRHLSSRRPDDAVVGEEYGTEGSGRRRWIVDPIDGTKNFVRGVPVWASLIALEDDGELVVGVASAPALGRRWWASRGAGAFADGKPIHVSSITSLADAQLSFASVNGWAGIGRLDPLLSLASRCWRTRGFGDFWSHVLVAEGACDIGLDPVVSLWDLAALQVIVEEAGGRFTDLAGVSRADGGSAVSSNGALHDEVLALLNPDG
jgi:histidinol-phosphatase